MEIAAGQTLIAQGDPGDSMYLSISGRLRAYIRDEDGVQRMVREMGRGQVIGEMSLYTDEPRSATVVAIRDSVLVRLDKPAFNRLLSSSAQVSIALTRQLIHRLQTAQPRSDFARPVTIGLLPITGGVQTLDFAALGGNCALLRNGGPTRGCASSMPSDRSDLRQPGLARCPAADAAANRRIALHLDELEATHDYVLLVADDEPSPWTQRCSRRCDEMLLLADATSRPSCTQPRRSA